MLDFPNPLQVDGDLVAIGGDLSPSILIEAYRCGIFPWYNEGDPILWWSLDPRFVLFPKNLHIPRRLIRTIRHNNFTLTIDTDFPAVINACSHSLRSKQKGTWITKNMIQAYSELHHLGYAHSVEVWQGNTLVGGLYGVAMGGCFSGESMFFHQAEASKIAFIALLGTLFDANFGMIDCQQNTSHLKTFGALDVPRSQFLTLLEQEQQKPSKIGNWFSTFPDFPQSRLWENLMQETCS